jgi:hypothetical protein
MRHRFVVERSATLWIAIAALILGYALGHGGTFGQAGAVGSLLVDDRGTPTGAEGGAVAEVVCTPAPQATATVPPTPTATPTPEPPAMAGQPVPYGEDWTITVTALYLTPTVGSFTAEGIFAVVAMTITNDGLRERNFRFAELRIQDAAGREYRPASAYTGTAWTMRFAPGIPADVTIAFDVAADTGEWFIVQSRTDPSFRVRVEQSQLG